MAQMRTIVECIACAACVNAITKSKFSENVEGKKIQQCWAETSENLNTRFLRLLDNVDKRMAMNWSLVVTKLEGKDRVISRQAYSELIDNVMGPAFNKDEAVRTSTVPSMASSDFNPLPWDEETHPLLSFLTLQADRARQRQHIHLTVFSFALIGNREMEAAVTEASSPSETLANFGVQSVCQVAGVAATCLLFKRLWPLPLPLPPSSVVAASNGGRGFVPSLFNGSVRRGLMSTFVVVPLCLLVHTTVATALEQGRAKRHLQEAQAKDGSQSLPVAQREHLPDLYYSVLPPVWPGATRDDPFTKERIAMGVGQGLVNEITFRFLLFRSMLSYIRHDFFLHVLALNVHNHNNPMAKGRHVVGEVKASGVTPLARAAEMADRKNIHGDFSPILYPFTLAACFAATGSIAYPCLLHGMLYSQDLVNEAMSREDLMWEELSIYPVAVATANLLLDDLGLDRVLRGGVGWWAQRRRKEDAVTKLAQAAIGTDGTHGLYQHGEKGLSEEEAMTLTVALHSALAHADMRPINDKSLTWWEAKEAECYSSIELGPKPGPKPIAEAIASRNLLSLRHFIIALHRERAKKVLKRGLGSREAEMRALVGAALGSRDIQHVDVEAAARHLSQWDRASDEDVMDLLEDECAFIHNYMMREMLRFRVARGINFALQAAVEVYGPQWSEKRSREVYLVEMMSFFTWHNAALEKARGAYLASKGLTFTRMTSLVHTRAAESTDFARFHTEWNQQMNEMANKWAETAHPSRFPPEILSQ